MNALRRIAQLQKEELRDKTGRLWKVQEPTLLQVGNPGIFHVVTIIHL